MANFEELKDDVLEDVAGGAGKIKVYGQSTDPNAAHYQPKDHKAGDEWVDQFGHTWYMIRPGDTLYNIAVKYHTTLAAIKSMNPATIQDVGKIYANDAIIVR